MELCGKISLLCSTTRHLTPAQMYYRARRMARRQWWKVGDKRAPQPSNCALAAHRPLYSGLTQVNETGSWANEVAGSIQRAANIARGRFDFLNHSVDCGITLPWNDSKLSQLWRYHLHYF